MSTRTTTDVQRFMSTVGIARTADGAYVVVIDGEVVARSIHKAEVRRVLTMEHARHGRTGRHGQNIRTSSRTLPPSHQRKLLNAIDAKLSAADERRDTL